MTTTFEKSSNQIIATKIYNNLRDADKRPTYLNIEDEFRFVIDQNPDKAQSTTPYAIFKILEKMYMNEITSLFQDLQNSEDF